jgi:MSHA biogenesis protein MshN
MLVRLQLDTGRVEEAVALLVEGQRLHPEQPDFTVTLARLRAETGDNAGAIQLLEEGRLAAGDEPQYHALLAALLVRAQRHGEAVQHYLLRCAMTPRTSAGFWASALRWKGQVIRPMQPRPTAGPKVRQD